MIQKSRELTMFWFQRLLSLMFFSILVSTNSFANTEFLKTDITRAAALEKTSVDSQAFKKSWLLTKSQDLVFPGPDGTMSQFHLPVNSLRTIQTDSSGRMLLRGYTNLLSTLQLELSRFLPLEPMINNSNLTATERSQLRDRLPAYIPISSEAKRFNGPSSVVYGAGYNHFGQLELDTPFPGGGTSPRYTHYEFYEGSLNPRTMNIRNATILRVGRNHLNAKLTNLNFNDWRMIDNDTARAPTDFVNRFDRYFDIDQNLEAKLSSSAILDIYGNPDYTAASLMTYTGAGQPYKTVISLGPSKPTSARDTRSQFDRYFAIGWPHYWKYAGSFSLFTELAFDYITYPGHTSSTSSPRFELNSVKSSAVISEVSGDRAIVDVPISLGTFELESSFVLNNLTPETIVEAPDTSTVRRNDDDDDDNYSYGRGSDSNDWGQLNGIIRSNLKSSNSRLGRNDSRYIWTDKASEIFQKYLDYWRDLRNSAANVSRTVTDFSDESSAPTGATTSTSKAVDTFFEKYVADTQAVLQEDYTTVDCSEIDDAIKRQMCEDLELQLNVTSPSLSESFLRMSFRQLKYDTLQRMYYYTLTNNQLYYISLSSPNVTSEITLTDFGDSTVKDFTILALFDDGLVSFLEILSNGTARKTLRRINGAAAQAVSSMYVDFSTPTNRLELEGYHIVDACRGRGLSSSNASTSTEYGWGTVLLRKYPVLTKEALSQTPDDTQTRLLTFVENPSLSYSRMPRFNSPETLDMVATSISRPDPNSLPPLPTIHVPGVNDQEILSIDCGTTHAMAITADLDGLRSSNPQSNVFIHIWGQQNVSSPSGGTTRQFAAGYGTQYAAHSGYHYTRLQVSDFPQPAEASNEAGERNRLIPLKLFCSPDSEQSFVYFGDVVVN